MLQKESTYEQVCSNFKWEIPEFYNIGIDICDKWAGATSRNAIIFETESGEVREYTFSALKDFSDRLANVLKEQGLVRGDRVGILLPQCPETAISHIAAYKIGAIAVPLFTLFGPDALEYRLGNSGAKAIVTDSDNLEKILDIRANVPSLETVIIAGEVIANGTIGFWDSIHQASTKLEPVNTSADDPALIIYTSGTTGPPKGALHAHRTLLGHLPGVELPHNFFPQEGDLFWTPADWAWIGGLIDVLFPSLHHGIPILAYRARKFDPEEAFYLIAKHKVRNTFMPPTALKMMRQVNNPGERYDFNIRTIGSGGETLGKGLLEWGKEIMGVEINEFYGQTEVNLVVSNCAEIMDIRAGSMGRAVPGHIVEVVDENGNTMDPGETGEVAIKRPDPVMFLEYWQNRSATADKFINDWCLTGDLAKKDKNGYFWFVGRKDDIITSAGYRIGPGEIEDCLMKHPAVGMAAAVGIPDEVRTEIVKAFIVLKPGVGASELLEREIKNFVKERLAAHEYPREVEFIESLPMTATGKIMRKVLKKRT